MRKTGFLLLLLAMMAFSIRAWSYRMTDNYTIETKFKINAIGAGIAFRSYEGFGGGICMWQFNVGTEGNKSLFRPHDWKVGGILLGEIDTRNYGVTLNNTDWFVVRIVVSNNGQHADTYLRRADVAEFTLIDQRDGNFRYGLVGTRQDHDGNINGLPAMTTSVSRPMRRARCCTTRILRQLTVTGVTIPIGRTVTLLPMDVT